MGGFNFSTEDKILRYIFRGDTIYEVIIPDDAEVINVDEEKGIYRANKIIVTNPRNIPVVLPFDLDAKSSNSFIASLIFSLLTISLIINLEAFIYFLNNKQ